MATPFPSPRAAILLAALAGSLVGCARGTRTEPTPSPTGTAADQGEGSTTVTAADLQRGADDSIERALMSRVPGLWVTRTSDGGIAIRIRGSTSIHGSTEPLFILDGLAFQPGPGGSLAGINPYDIQSIEVLKDAAGTAMYGVRGANGVIIIKTKRPGH